MPRQTFEDKAKALVDQLVEDGLDVGAMMHRQMEKRIVRLLKEQDRDTRHGCAEAVQQLPDENEMCADSNVKWIDADDAHSTCMNYQHQ